MNIEKFPITPSAIIFNVCYTKQKQINKQKPQTKKPEIIVFVKILAVISNQKN